MNCLAQFISRHAYSRAVRAHTLAHFSVTRIVIVTSVRKMDGILFGGDRPAIPEAHKNIQ